MTEHAVVIAGGFYSRTIEVLESHPVAARAIQHTMAQAALQRRDERIQALVDVVSELAGMDEPRKRLAGIISGLDIHYDLGEATPLLGRRVPDLDLVRSCRCSARSPLPPPS